MLEFFDYSDIPASKFEALRNAFGSFSTLQQVLDWGRTSDPRVDVDEIVTMDEYTHDVLVALPDGRYLAFDTT